MNATRIVPATKRLRVAIGPRESSKRSKLRGLLPLLNLPFAARRHPQLLVRSPFRRWAGGIRYHPPASYEGHVHWLVKRLAPCSAVRGRVAVNGQWPDPSLDAVVLDYKGDPKSIRYNSSVVFAAATKESSWPTVTSTSLRRRSACTAKASSSVCRSIGLER
jgi:hypothetical protein